MTFPIMPHASVGPVRFGIARDALHAALGEGCEPFRRNPAKRVQDEGNGRVGTFSCPAI